MNQYIVSYVHESGITILNQIVNADSWTEAIDEIAPVARIILSCVNSEFLTAKKVVS